MGKALVIRGADFSANKVATVSFTEVHCTNVAISSAAETLAFGSTLELTATPTPVNTTDPVVWTSSDESVATVEGGTVSFVKAGTAAIIATCGNFSAACEVTCTVGVVLHKGAYCRYSGVDAINISNTTGNYSIYGCDTNTRKILDYAPFDVIYPYPIPAGAVGVKVEAEDVACIVVWMNSQADQSSSSSAIFAGCAKAVYGETFASGYDYSIAAWTWDSRTLEIPDMEGIDSFVLCLYAKDASTQAALTADDVAISFVYPEPEEEEAES